MRPAQPVEQRVGMAYYASEAAGTGGRLKATDEDFVVTELEAIDPRPLDSNPGDFPVVIVRAQLEGWDTYDFAARLARSVGVHREAVRWAGTKDKEAITTQLFSIRGIDPDDLPAIPHAKLEPIGRFGRGLTFGDLVGNAFEIRVRDPVRPEQHKEITRQLRSFGNGTCAVPNYYGQQRFGTARAITHLVGLAILERDWKKAVLTYLGASSDREPSKTQQARQFLQETEDWERAQEQFPGGLGHERRLLQRLQNIDPVDSTDFRSALEAFPEGLRRLFVHAAQSYLFNRILSKRLEDGLPLATAVPGDIVMFSRETNVLDSVPDPDRLQHVSENRVKVVNRHIDAGRAMVAGPLIGTDTEFATGEPGEIERSVLDEAGLDREAFDLPQPYQSSGTRRAYLCHVEPEISTSPLKFKFPLPSGSYATVVMREYLKVDPSDLG